MSPARRNHLRSGARDVLRPRKSLDTGGARQQSALQRGGEPSWHDRRIRIGITDQSGQHSSDDPYLAAARLACWPAWQVWWRWRRARGQQLYVHRWLPEADRASLNMRAFRVGGIHARTIHVRSFDAFKWPRHTSPASIGLFHFGQLATASAICLLTADIHSETARALAWRSRAYAAQSASRFPLDQCMGGDPRGRQRRAVLPWDRDRAFNRIVIDLYSKRQKSAH